jgi:hypothetical protein
VRHWVHQAQLSVRPERPFRAERLDVLAGRAEHLPQAGRQRAALRQPEAASYRQPVVWRARRVVRSALSSGRPHSVASPVRRVAVVAPSSCFRRVEGRPLAALSESAWCQAPAAAWRQTAGAAAQAMVQPSEMKAAAEAVRPVASAPQARLPAEEAAASSGAQVQPQEAAGAESAPSVQRPVAAAEAVSGAGVVQPPEVAAALDAAAEPQQVVAAEALPDAEVLRPGAVERPAPSVRRPAAERPSALPSWRPGGPHLWLAP